MYPTQVERERERERERHFFTVLSKSAIDSAPSHAPIEPSAFVVVPVKCFSSTEIRLNSLCAIKFPLSGGSLK